MLEVQVAAAKVGKWATRESGDTLEMVERPHGGLSFVLADGQHSGRAAKRISNVVARKAISLLAEGVRDGAVARAAHDYLYTYRGGKVSATLNIVSVDLLTRTLVLSRNSPCPMLVVQPGEPLQVLDAPSRPVGIYRGTKPVITELPLEAGTTVVVYTDGLETAGQRYGAPMDVVGALQALLDRGADAQTIADELLAQAVALDRGRPADDISVLVLQIVPRRSEDEARRLTVRLPL
ncbi:MAG TPA: serine/threonine-protein phosphatase [Chloroflexi bacterium]|nr:serine/threonine-protein phosphatase [Chloroflexota bacterium]